MSESSHPEVAWAIRQLRLFAGAVTRSWSGVPLVDAADQTGTKTFEVPTRRGKIALV